KYTLTITYGTYGTYTLNPLTKEYDGAVPVAPTSIIIDGKDILTSSTNANFEFVDSTIGNVKKDVGNYKFTISAKSGKDFLYVDTATHKLYLVDNNNKDVNFAITAKPITINYNFPITPITYTGNEVVVSVTFSGLIPNESLNVTFLKTGANLGAGGTDATKFINAGSYTFTPSVADTATGKVGNYSFNIETKTIEISKATPTFVIPTLAGINYSPLTKLSSITIPNVNANGLVSWKDGTIIPSCDKTTYTATLLPTDTMNYNSADMEIGLVVSQIATIINTDNVNLQYSYTGVEQAVTSGATFNNTDAGAQLVYSNNKFINSSIVNGSKYTVTISSAKTTNYLEATASVEVDVLQADVTLDYTINKTIFVGQVLDQSWITAYTPASLIPGIAGSKPTINWETQAPIENGVANVTIVFTPSERGEGLASNYKSVTKTDTITARKIIITFTGFDSISSANSRQELPWHGSAILPTDPTKNADSAHTYIFSGWNGKYQNVEADTTITATFTSTHKLYTVTFNDGTSSPLVKSFYYGEWFGLSQGLVVANVPTEPTKVGSIFSAWYKEGTLFTSFDETYKITTDIVLNAVYVDLPTINVVYTSTNTLADVSSSLAKGFTFNNPTEKLKVNKNNYLVKFEREDTINYGTSGDLQATINVEKANGIIIDSSLSADKQFVYNGSAQSLKTTLFSHNNTDGAILEFVNNSFTNYSTAYTITINLAETENFKSATKDVVVTISKGDIEFTLNTPNQIYVGQENAINELFTCIAKFNAVDTLGKLDVSWKDGKPALPTKGVEVLKEICVTFTPNNTNLNTITQSINNVGYRWILVEYFSATHSNENIAKIELFANPSYGKVYCEYNSSVTLPTDVPVMTDVTGKYIYEYDNDGYYEFTPKQEGSQIFGENKKSAILTNITSDKNFYAVFTSYDTTKYATVELKLADGDINNISKSWILKNTILTIPALPTNGNKIFENWNKGASLYDFKTAVTENLVLYAVFSDVPVCAGIKYSKDLKLSSIVLPENWAWANGDTIPSVKVGKYSAVHTRKDNINYPNVTVDLSMAVSKSDAIINISALIKEYVYTGENIIIISGAEALGGGIISYGMPAGGMKDVKSYTIRIMAGESDNYNAGEITTDVKVIKADFTISGLDYKKDLFKGQPLSSVWNNAGYTAMFGMTPVVIKDITYALSPEWKGNGNYTITATFIPESLNFNNVNVNLAIGMRYITIVFKNYDGTILQTLNNIEYGQTVSTRVSPEKPSNNTTIFTFSGWDKPLTLVQESFETTAQFAETVRKYNVDYYKYNYLTNQYEKIEVLAKQYLYNDKIIDIPEYTSANIDGYYFKAWTKEDKETYFNFDTELVTANTSIYAKHREIPTSLNTQSMKTIYTETLKLSDIVIPSDFAWINPQIKLTATGASGTAYSANYDYFDGLKMTNRPVELSVIIDKANIDISNVVFVDKNVIYDSTLQTITISSVLPDNVVVSYKNGLEEFTGATFVGIYVITAEFIAKDLINYNDNILTKTATLQIRNKEIGKVDTESGKPTIKIDSENGFYPNAEIIDELVVDEIRKQIIGSYIETDELLKSYKSSAVMNYKIVKSNGEQLSIDGKVTIKLLIMGDIPVLDTYKILIATQATASGASNTSDATKFVVIDAVRDGDYIVFDTTELGDMVVLSQVVETAPKANVNLGVILAIAGGSVILLGIIITIIVVAKKKKK
ncbi:MAG: InlB B-repeat-containing protein, partial [Clostridia bacterium]